MDISLDAQIEGFLFYIGEPTSYKKIAQTFSVSEEVVREALTTLEERLVGRGISVIRTDTTVALATAPALKELITTLRKQTLERDLGKAGLETLTLVIYRSPIARADIDFIRGVNSSYIVRNLLVRGLVEKIVDPQDSRRFLYTPTLDLLRYLGVTHVEELPDYETIRTSISVFEEEQLAEKDQEKEPEPENDL